VSQAFEVAAGSVLGREHAAAGRNNQDAFCWLSAPGLTLGVVSDGCGSGRHSELGARLGARLAVESLRREAARLALLPAEEVLETVRRALLAELERLARGLGGRLEQVVADYLLFTLVGAAITESDAVVFCLGDGVAALNGRTALLALPDNAPPYLAYALTRPSDAPRFRILWRLPAEQVDSILLGSDGVADLVREEARRLPGRPEPSGPLRQFWEEDRYFRNPAGLTRRLTLLNRPASRIDWERRRVERELGLLPDDTTLVVIRRRRESALDAA
jgi:hypothetical protein